ncbi:MAG: primosomal protein N', partial [Alphaproteobacteria bacterium]|nr:primosomal protein N' [Alphaproteobacteria bacterium]
MTQTVGVLLPLPFDKPFDYTADFDVQVGQIVEVPFGKEKQIGVVWTLEASPELEQSKIKPILKRFDFPPLTAQMLEFIKWVA